jgi:hypothetical protein
MKFGSLTGPNRTRAGIEVAKVIRYSTPATSAVFLSEPTGARFVAVV